MLNQFLSAYDNNLDAFIPEQWANESIALLMENMVAASLVHRDFEMDFAKKGQTVHTRKPAHFTAKRKGRHDSVSVQDASAADVEVKLDQHVGVSFLIEDGDETMAFTSLVDFYIRPAAIALARHADRIVLGQYPQFLVNQVGTLGGGTTSNAANLLAETERRMNDNLAEQEDRRLIVGSRTKSLFMQNNIFHEAHRLGDDGSALRRSHMGEKFGFDLFLDQNMASNMRIDSSLGSGTVNNGGGYPKGATVLTVANFGAGEVVPGDWISINGNVYHVVATNNATATEITLEYGLVTAVANTDAIVVYDRGAINQTLGSPDGYPKGYEKEIVVDGFSGTPINRGQIVSFGTSTVKYVVIATNGATEILLDRPLEEAHANGVTVHLGPVGDYNLAFHRNAMTLAIRPLALPRSGTNSISGLANYNDLTIRTVITYDPYRQGHLVTLDFLAGIKVLDVDRAAVLLT